MRLFTVILSLTFVGVAFLRAAVPKENVVVVANTLDDDSMAIAEYYLQKRDIPPQNLIALPFPTTEAISGEVFIQEVLNPLREKLVETKWINGEMTDLTDALGRRRIKLRGHKIGFLVLCRLPYQVTGYSEENRSQYSEKAPSDPKLQSSNAALDSELALMLYDELPVNGPLANHLFRQENPSIKLVGSVMRVARLDGPSVSAVKGMIDSALIGEAKGIRGRAYVDMGGPHDLGEQWLEQCINQFGHLYFPTSIDRQKPRFAWTHRLDAPAFYIGWWTHRPDGAFEDRSYRLPPGAVAIHISSFSGQHLRHPKRRWSGVLVDRGVAATVGNVYEPYLGLTHHPQLFFSALERGMSAGEAAAYSMPVASWNALFIGDPLYQPFQVNLAQQLANLDENDPWDPYVVLRKAEQIRARSGDDAAFDFLKTQSKRAPGLALAYAIAEGYEARGLRETAVDQLRYAARLPAFSAEDRGLAFQTAELLVQMQAHELAYEIMKTLANQTRSDDARLAFMPPAISIAKQLGHQTQAGEWESIVDAINQKRAPKP